MNERIEDQAEWKDIVSHGNPAALKDMTFMEFMHMLDREIAKRERELKEYEKAKQK